MSQAIGKCAPCGSRLWSSQRMRWGFVALAWCCMTQVHEAGATTAPHDDSDCEDAMMFQLSSVARHRMATPVGQAAPGGSSANPDAAEVSKLTSHPGPALIARLALTSSLATGAGGNTSMGGTSGAGSATMKTGSGLDPTSQAKNAWWVPTKMAGERWTRSWAALNSMSATSVLNKSARKAANGRPITGIIAIYPSDWLFSWAVVGLVFVVCMPALFYLCLNHLSGVLAEKPAQQTSYHDPSATGLLSRTRLPPAVWTTRPTNLY